MVALHVSVQGLASEIELHGGVLQLSDEACVRFSRRVAKLRAVEEKKAVLVSVVALASRLAREGQEAAMPAVNRLMDLAAGLIGDPSKARALFQAI